jgi:hypothetical protein
LVAQKSGQHILLGPSWLHEQAAQCPPDTPLQAFARASQAKRPTVVGHLLRPRDVLAHRPSAKSGAAKLVCPTLRRTPAARSSTSLMLGSAAFTLAMSARATSSSAGVGRMAPIVAVTLRGWSTEPRIRGAIPRADYIRTIRSTPVRGLRKCPWRFGRFLKASMLGFTLVSRSYYYLRRRSPAPPFPPDDRQAQGTGGYR